MNPGSDLTKAVCGQNMLALFHQFHFKLALKNKAFLLWEECLGFAFMICSLESLQHNFAFAHNSVCIMSFKSNCVNFFNLMPQRLHQGSCKDNILSTKQLKASVNKIWGTRRIWAEKKKITGAQHHDTRDLLCVCVTCSASPDREQWS